MVQLSPLMLETSGACTFHIHVKGRTVHAHPTALTIQRAESKAIKNAHPTALTVHKPAEIKTQL